MRSLTLAGSKVGCGTGVGDADDAGRGRPTATAGGAEGSGLGVASAPLRDGRRAAEDERGRSQEQRQEAVTRVSSGPGHEASVTDEQDPVRAPMSLGAGAAGGVGRGRHQDEHGDEHGDGRRR